MAVAQRTRTKKGPLDHVLTDLAAFAILHSEIANCSMSTFLGFLMAVLCLLVPMQPVHAVEASTPLNTGEVSSSKDAAISSAPLTAQAISPKALCGPGTFFCPTTGQCMAKFLLCKGVA